MSKFEIFYDDLKDLDGYYSADFWWRKVYADDQKHIYLFQAVQQDGSVREDLYEMQKAVRYKQPDGSIVYRKVKSSEWGTRGWTLWGNKQYCLEKFRKRYMDIVGKEPEKKDILLDEK